MSSTAQILAGEIVQDQVTQARSRIPVDVLNLHWVWAHFPLAWQFKDGVWLPELSNISFRKGLNGQDQDGATSAPKQHVIAKGGTIIEPGNNRLGKYRNYVRSFPAFHSQTKQTGTFYASMFEVPTLIGGRHAKWKLDTIGYDTFRAFLVEKGIIEPIDASIIEAKIDEAQNFCDHLKGLPDSQLRRERIRDLEDKIDAMRKSLEDAEERASEEVPEGQIEEVETEDEANADAKPAPRRKPGK